MNTYTNVGDEDLEWTIEVVDELEFDSFIDEGDLAASPAAAPTRPAAAQGPTDPFGLLVAAAERVARLHGAGDEVLSALRSELGVEQHAAEPRASALGSRARAWQRVLRGEELEYDGCGAQPLDEWTAELVAAAIRKPDLSATIRRELRSCGVVAFGIVVDDAA